MFQATLALGVNFNVPLNSLTNHNTSANAAYNQSNYGANFGTKTWVNVDPYPTGTQAPVDPSLMDKSLNPITPGHVSKTDVHTLVPSRPDLRWFAHSVPWFGSGGHINIGETNNTTSYVSAMITDMKNRGFNGVIVDWYGQNSYEDLVLLKIQSYLHSQTNNTFKYIIMVDKGVSGGLSTNNLINQINYCKSQYFSDTNYECEPVSSSNPVLMFFNVRLDCPGGAGEMSYVKSSTGANAVWVEEGAGYLGESWDDEGFEWTDEFVHGVSATDPFNTNQVYGFCWEMKHTYPTKKAFGAMCAKFNGTLTGSTNWSMGKYLPSSNGLCMVTRAAIINSAIPTNIVRMQWLTWSDWEEGSQVESGIPNYFTVSPQVNSTNLLTWTITGGDERTVDHYELYASADGVNAAYLGPVATGHYQTNLNQVGLSPGTYQVFVDAIGKPCIRDNLSSAATCAFPPSAPTGVIATGGSGRVDLTWNPSTGATSYVVSYSTTSGGPYTAVQTNATASASITGLANGTTYYFVVVASNSGGSSPNSAEVSATPSAFNPLNFSTQMQITLGGYNRGSTLTNFPLLVYLGSNISGFSYSQLAPGGTDLRFVDGTGAVLNYEIDQWNTNGVSSVWVLVPQIASNATAIEAYWGNPALTKAPVWTTNGSTWPNYLAVFHLKESGFPYADSTAFHPATAGQAPTVTTTSLIGSGEIFNGTSQYLAPAGAVNLGNSFSLSGWVKLGTNANNIQTLWANKVAGGTANGLALYVNSYNTTDGKVVLETGTGTIGTNALSTSGAVPVNGWHHVFAAVNRAGGTATLYVDGVNCTASSPICPDFANNTATAMGAFISNAWFLNGTLDEARLEAGRSADWVWATWMNVVSNSVLASYSPAAPTLAAPTGVAATATTSQATLTWNSVSGATSYTVHYGTTSGGPYPSSQTSSTTSATIASLSNGTTYYFVVVANDAGGSSANSAEVSATPLAAPTGVMASATNAQVTVSWSAVTAATSYTVAYGTTSGGPYPNWQNSSTTSATISGLANGTTYYFVVAANDYSGSSVNSAEVSATPSAPLVKTNDYSRSMKITFAGYNRGTAVTDFPVLVNLSSNIAGFAYNQFVPGGTDLCFADSTGALLNHEIDTWNTNGVSTVWVRVPRMGSSTDSITAYWGNPSLTNTPASCTNGSVWYNDAAVFHLRESGFPYADSTTLHPATNGTAPTLTPSGMVADGQVFNGTSQYLAPSASINVGSGFSLSGWVKLNTNASNIQALWANKPGGGTANGFALYVNSYNTTDGKLVLETGDGTVGTNAMTGTGAVPGGGWHHLFASVNRTAGTANLYVDGVDRTASSGICRDFATNSLLNLGRFTDGFWYVNGTLDEARIETVNHSADWAWASWMTVASNAVLSSYGPAVLIQALDPNAFGSGMKITLAGYSRSSTLTNFPLLVNLGSSLSGFDYSQFASPAGYDLRFTDASGQQLLNYETDTWNTNGVSSVWVSVPAIASSSNYIMAYWGNPALTNGPAAFTTNGATWGSFATVFHLRESGLPYADSTTLHPATNGTAPTLTPSGMVANGQVFNGTSEYLVPADAMNVGNGFSLSGWVKLSTNASNIQTLWANKSGGGTMNGFALYVNSYNTTDGKLVLETGDGTVGTNAVTSTGAVPVGGWHHLFASVNRNAGTANLYVDGVDCTASGSICRDFATNSLLNLGRFTNGFWYLNGTLDEARIETVNHSADWAWASWMTVVSNALFSGYSSVTPHGQGLQPLLSLGPSLLSPRLTLSVSGNSLLLRWAQSSGYLLYSSTNLAAPGAWTPVTNPPTASNGQMQLELPIEPTGARFYRLQAN